MTPVPDDYHSSSDRDILFDSHIHFHRCCTSRAFVRSTLSNLKRFSGLTSDNFVAALAIVDAMNEDGFVRLAESLGISESTPSDSDEWFLRPTTEPVSICIEVNGTLVVVIRGRQIRTLERLEVLAIGTAEKIIDGQPIAEVIQEVNDLGAMPVIPWGFGKWFGARAEVMESLLDHFDRDAFFLGDNANRPGFVGRPRIFAIAESRGFRVLPGSDPLPFASECGRAGRTGVRLPGPLDLSRPAEELKQKVVDRNTRLEPFMSLERPARFLRNQFRMQYQNLSDRH